MNSKTEHALLLALEALLKKGAKSSSAVAALEAIDEALKSGGWRYRDKTNTW